jgi:hypothetical protein
MAADKSFNQNLSNWRNPPATRTYQLTCQTPQKTGEPLVSIQFSPMRFNNIYQIDHLRPTKNLELAWPPSKWSDKATVLNNRESEQNASGDRHFGPIIS